MSDFDADLLAAFAREFPSEAAKARGLAGLRCEKPLAVVLGCHSNFERFGLVTTGLRLLVNAGIAIHSLHLDAAQELLVDLARRNLEGHPGVPDDAPVLGDPIEVVAHARTHIRTYNQAKIVRSGHDWRRDRRSMLLAAGAGGRPVLVLAVDGGDAARKLVTEARAMDGIEIDLCAVVALDTSRSAPIIWMLPAADRLPVLRPFKGKIPSSAEQRQKREASIALRHRRQVEQRARIEFRKSRGLPPKCSLINVPDAPSSDGLRGPRPKGVSVVEWKSADF